MSLLILVRHGQTQYNLDHKFCGLTDVDLAEIGRQTAQVLGTKLSQYRFDFIYTSNLKRSLQTAQIILQTINQLKVPLIQDKSLNERDYGDLTGKTHQEIADLYGQDQVKLWRRSWSGQPPGGESLAQVYERVIPYFETEILPKLKANHNILIAAHGNSLRALIKYLDKIEEEKIAKLEILYDEPYVYQIEAEGIIKRLDKNPREFTTIAK